MVGGRAQQNGMGFGNKNLLGEKKGRSWCLLLMLRGLNIGPVWEGLSHYYKPLFPFCPEWRTERTNLILGLWDGCKVYPTAEIPGIGLSS